MRGETDSECVHATAIAVAGRGALIRGPSGSGKSDLALRCLSLAPSTLLPSAVELVADDQVILTRDETANRARLIATAPQTLRGRLEVRGVGIIDIATIPAAEIALVVDLTLEGPCERFPDPWNKVLCAGFDVPVLRLSPFTESAAQKVIAALLLAGLPPTLYKR